MVLLANQIESGNPDFLVANHTPDSFFKTLLCTLKWLASQHQVCIDLERHLVTKSDVK